MDWINIHTHRPGNGLNIADPCLGEMQVPEGGQVYYSRGIHPLHVDETSGLRLEEIEEAAKKGRIVAIGEAGVDRNAPADLEVQMNWFQRQAEVAERYGLPLIIHGVRAVPEIIRVFNRCRSPRKWIMHGFNNRRELLADLLKHGFYISAGRQVMNTESHIYRLLPEIPADRLFVETDDSEFRIEEIYRMVAERRKIGVRQLQEMTEANFRKIFAHVPVP